MIYYKKYSDNKIYSFPAMLTREEYDDFQNGVVSGILIGDTYVNPFVGVRTMDSTAWEFPEPLSIEDFDLFNTGTTSFNKVDGDGNVYEIVGVFNSFPIEHPLVKLPDWAMLRQRLYSTQAHAKAVLSGNNKYSLTGFSILGGELYPPSVYESTLKLAIETLIADLVGTPYEFDSFNIQEINNALLDCQFSITI